MPPTRADWTAVRGDAFAKNVTAYDATGAILDLTGKTVWFTVKDAADQGTDDTNAITRCYWVSGGSSSGITVSAPTTGVIQIVAPGSDMAALNPERRYVYDVQVLLNSQPYTLVYGDISVLSDVTRRVTTP